MVLKTSLNCLKREAQRNVEERRAAKEAERRAEVEFWQQQRAEQAANDQMIEAERDRLLREHARRLIGFMPTGLLKSKDLEMLAAYQIKWETWALCPRHHWSLCHHKKFQSSCLVSGCSGMDSNPLLSHHLLRP